MASTINQLVHDLLADSGSFTVRLQEPDRNDVQVTTYKLLEMNPDTLLGGGVSGFEAPRYTVTVRGNDAETVEEEAITLRNTLDALPINTEIDSFQIQSCYTQAITDESLEEPVSDAFEYQSSFILNLAIGRLS